MSEEQRDLYYHDPFNEGQRTNETQFSFFGTNSSIDKLDESLSPNHQRFHDPSSSSYMGFNQNQFLNDHNNTSTSVFDSVFSFKDEQKAMVDTENPVTPNSSSVLSSSTEAYDEEQELNDGKKNLAKGVFEDGKESSKKVNKQKNKGEKKQREPRFAFMTKSEVDHLEDGYRWRKYGQKAVKNSPYPRSYYRCTTQKCTVKKRVERSFQDPSTVITTYEGQHNHHLPATLRGNVMYPPSMMAAQGAMIGDTNFHHELLAHMHHDFHNHGGGGGGSGAGGGGGDLIYQKNTLTPLQQLQIHDYGLLQDMVPSMTFKQEH